MRAAFFLICPGRVKRRASGCQRVSVFDEWRAIFTENQWCLFCFSQLSWRSAHRREKISLLFKAILWIHWTMSCFLRGILSRVLLVLWVWLWPCLGLGLAAVAADDTGRWWKGNLHAHSLWSDGDDYPEMIADWYRERGYHFLAISDHNNIQSGERWHSVTNRPTGPMALERYVRRFGSRWVWRRTRGGIDEVRLRSFSEYRPLFEKAGRFLLIPAEEITARHLVFPVHINAINLRGVIEPLTGDSVLEVMRRNVDAVLEQRARTHQPMFPHLNHPNFGWGVTAEDLARVGGERFFEVYNGHPAVRNEGDANHPGTERIWDIVLTRRLAELGLPPLFGTATDDSHNYHTNSSSLSNSGRGWVMVRSRLLTAESLIRSMELGEFYATTGVRLTRLQQSREGIELRIQAEPGVSYQTHFVGTLRGYDTNSEPVLDKVGNMLPITRRYSSDIGRVLAVVDGVSASYRLGGQEVYVRARVISTKPKANGIETNEVERAWTQPVSPVRR